MTVPNIVLNDSVTIPQLGFGTMDIYSKRDGDPHGDDITAAGVAEAIAVGYRHFDTAQMYVNERGVGKAISAAGIPMADFFVTSKLSNANHHPDDVKRSFDKTLTDLGLETLDLFLLHWPLPSLDGDGFVATWRAMTELLDDGRVRSIGVSNFTPEHLDRIIQATGVVPSVNQIEVYPYFGNTDTTRVCATLGIAVEAWSPLGKATILSDPTIVQIAAEYGRTAAQVVLRWHTQRGRIVIPKSANPGRMLENFNSFDFSLLEEDLLRLDGLDRGEAGRMGPHPDEFAWVPTADTPRPPIAPLK